MDYLTVSTYKSLFCNIQIIKKHLPYNVGTFYKIPDTVSIKKKSKGVNTLNQNGTITFEEYTYPYE